MAVDLPGFGRSECRDDLVSLEPMAGFVLRTAEAFGLENPHAVGPGTGTPALLLAAARHPGANSLLGRLIRPEEVASLITYVATEHASATTGAALSVDGGLVPTIFP
ncbi:MULTISPECIES: alpha/beta fold hydrolase [unclassified Streptomyces]|uniref:alpha/beta fold hydrolase n=1 Tax=unclassified Streptomyces TaxID=2593676 RepID=UPI0004C7AECD|nr:hypothetical protein ADL02_05975 [Streptomyces sp. NRRL WC-3723]